MNCERMGETRLGWWRTDMLILQELQLSRDDVPRPPGRESIQRRAVNAHGPVRLLVRVLHPWVGQKRRRYPLLTKKPHMLSEAGRRGKWNG